MPAMRFRRWMVVSGRPVRARRSEMAPLESMPTAPAKKGMAATQPLEARGQVAGAVEVAGEPCDIEPDGVVDAAPAEHHAPDGALAEEGAPGSGLGGGWGVEGEFFDGEGGFVAGAVEGDPEDGRDDADGAEGGEHGAPTDAEHEEGKGGWCDRQADGLGGAHDGGGAAAGSGGEPLADAADSGGR